MSKSNKNDRRRSNRDEKHRQTKQRQETLRREQKKQDEPNLRLVGETPSGSDSMPSPPSRMSMERTMREFHQMLESQNFASEDDMHAFMDEFNARGGSPLPTAGGVRSASEKAQELAYDAMEADDIKTAVILAMQAVELDRRCVDALVILAHGGSESQDELIENLEKTVWIGEQALGEDFFDENRGHFWGLMETRPYMRARQELADLLCGAGRTDEAIAHYEAMLDLNPNDNQGIREVLLTTYLTRGDLDGARRLFAQYEEDGSAAFRWSRVLERHLAGDEAKAVTLLAEARKDNAFVEPYLTGAKRMPRSLPEYYSPGEESEAKHVAVSLRPAWKRHRASMAWLKAQA
jgi:tetratricopeptide (TPR) repeat protein